MEEGFRSRKSKKTEENRGKSKETNENRRKPKKIEENRENLKKWTKIEKNWRKLRKSVKNWRKLRKIEENPGKSKETKEEQWKSKKIEWNWKKIEENRGKLKEIEGNRRKLRFSEFSKLSNFLRILNTGTPPYLIKIHESYNSSLAEINCEVSNCTGSTAAGKLQNRCRREDRYVKSRRAIEMQKHRGWYRENTNSSIVE